MQKLIKFINSNLHYFMITIFTFVGWIIDAQFTLVGRTISVNEIFLTIIVLWAAIILALVKDTKNVIFILIAALLTLSTQNLGINTINDANFLYIIVAIFFIGLLTHIFRFRYHFKWGYMTIGFTLMALSYFLPIIFEDIEATNLLYIISSIGIIYLVIYWFINSTSSAKTEDLLKNFFFMSIIILLQLYYTYIVGYIGYGNLSFLEKLETGLKTGWGRHNFGYGNINDVIIFLTIAFSGQLYYIHKNPNNVLYWFFPIISVFATLLSGSRGGWVIWILLMLLVYLFFLTQGNKRQIFFSSVAIIFILVPFVRYPEITKIFLETFKQGGFDDLNNFSSSRIQLYKDALAIFKKYPIFGGGWTAQFETYQNRIVIFHSSIFQTLAISGLFGFFSFIVFMMSSFVLFIKKMNYHVMFLLFSWIATFVHGLVDNTTHMVVFTILSILIFNAVENEGTSERPYKKEDRFYFLYDAHLEEK